MKPTHTVGFTCGLSLNSPTTFGNNNKKIETDFIFRWSSGNNFNEIGNVDLRVLFYVFLFYILCNLKIPMDTRLHIIFRFLDM